MHPRIPIVLVVTALTCVAIGAQAGSNEVPQAPRSLPTPPSAACCSTWSLLLPPLWESAGQTDAAAGLWYSRDPVDGALGMPPPAEIAAAFGRASLSENAPVQIELRADGTLIAHLDDRWANYSVATLGAAGLPAWMCLTGRFGLEQFLAKPVLVVAPPTVRRVDR